MFPSAKYAPITPLTRDATVQKGKWLSGGCSAIVKSPFSAWMLTLTRALQCMVFVTFILGHFKPS